MYDNANYIIYFLIPGERSEDGDQLGRRSLREPVCLSEMDYEHTPDKQTSVTDLVGMRSMEYHYYYY